MRPLTRIPALFLCLLIAGGTLQTADAQGVLGRARQKAREAAEKVAGKAADAATDKAADKAADAAANKVDEALSGSDAEAGTQANGQAGASGSGAANLGNALGAAMMGAGGGGGSVETVDFRELRALLPERAGSLARTDASGESGSAFGISTSSATGSYASANGESSVEVQITDMGTMRGFGMMGYAWAGAEIDSETDTGYERTVQYKGFPGYEQFENEGTASLSVIVGERFLVAVNGYGVPMSEVKATLDQIDVAKLDGMKEFGLGAGAEPLDFQQLKALLPGSVAGLSQTSSTGQKSNAMGIASSYAEGTYGSGDSMVKLTITDLGSLQGIGALGYTWMGVTMETETDTGYERTSQYKGFPAHERLDTSGGSSSAQMDVIVNQRFVVSAQGNGVTMDQVKAAIDAVDVSKLQVPEGN